jgi:hypothetical protein
VTRWEWWTLFVVSVAVIVEFSKAISGDSRPICFLACGVLGVVNGWYVLGKFDSYIHRRRGTR